MASFGISTVTIPQSTTRNSLKTAQFGNGIINNKIHMQESTYARHIHYALFGELEYMYKKYAISLSQYSLFKDNLK